MSIHLVNGNTSADIYQAVGANNKVIEAGEKHGVSTYIYIPCIVYGEGSGFGNRISIQTVAIVKAAKALRQVIDLEGAGVSVPARS
jgi:Na+-transporting NADH:ubiquinone oxidoreductase subunit NqrE